MNRRLWSGFLNSFLVSFKIYLKYESRGVDETSLLTDILIGEVDFENTAALMRDLAGSRNSWHASSARIAAPRRAARVRINATESGSGPTDCHSWASFFTVAFFSWLVSFFFVSTNGTEPSVGASVAHLGEGERGKM